MAIKRVYTCLKMIYQFEKVIDHSIFLKISNQGLRLQKHIQKFQKLKKLWARNSGSLKYEQFCKISTMW